MKKWVDVILPVAALVLLAASPAEAATRPPTAEQLQAHMLQLEDMPTGWIVDGMPPIDPSPTEGFCNGPNVAAMVAAIPGSRSGYTAFLKDPTAGPQIAEGIYSFSRVKDAKHLMAQMSHLAKACSAWDTTSATGLAAHYTLSPEAAGKVADQSLAMLYRASLVDHPSSVTATGDGRFARSGRVVVVVTQGGSSFDPALSRRLLAKALQRAEPLPE